MNINGSFKKGNKIRLGKKHSDKTKKKMSKTAKRVGKGKWLRGRVGNNKGKHWKVKDTSKMGRQSRGKNNWNWKGGYENTLMLNRKRRIMKIGNGGFHTLAEWETLKAQYNWTCLACGKQEPKITLSEDHIIPLSKGGSDNIENIQPLCRSCNSKKHDKIIKYE